MFADARATYATSNTTATTTVSVPPAASGPNTASTTRSTPTSNSSREVVASSHFLLDSVFSEANAAKMATANKVNAVRAERDKAFLANHNAQMAEIDKFEGKDTVQPNGLLQLDATAIGAFKKAKTLDLRCLFFVHYNQH